MVCTGYFIMLVKFKPFGIDQEMNYRYTGFLWVVAMIYLTPVNTYYFY